MKKLSLRKMSNLVTIRISLVAQTVSFSLQCGRPGFDPWVGWKRKWQPTPILLAGKSYGQRRMVGYSPWGHKELDTTECLHSLTLLPRWKKALEYMFGGVGIILVCSQEHRSKKRQRWWNTRVSARWSRTKVGGGCLFLFSSFSRLRCHSYFSFGNAKHIKQRFS